ncbi:MAG: glycosyltransferase family 39 protein [Bacteroidota bacterium]|jgi:hypothetical protein
MKWLTKITASPLLFTLLIALTRIPFLFFGYGSEEDAWALPLVAERIATNNVYEVSRLPGHPFQELIYTLIWNAGPVVYNLCTLLVSSFGLYFFIRILQHLKLEWKWATLSLAFTPIFYINCTNNMDYVWACSFIIISVYYLLNKRFLLTGLFIALAIGCRITSGVAIVPMIIFLIGNNRQHFLKNSFQLGLFTALFTLIIFIPVFKEYGLSFFTYYEHFPIPSFAKNFYKGSIGAFGITGYFGVFILIVCSFKKLLQERDLFKSPIVLLSLTGIIIFKVAFISLPLKSAFIIPILPYLFLMTAFLCSDKIQILGASLLIISCFFLGINLSDPLRGSKESAVSYTFQVSNQKVVFDVFSGIFTADITKRINRTEFSESVIQIASSITKPTYIIAGWYLSDILVLQKGRENKLVEYGYYTDESKLDSLKLKGIEIVFLPQQNELNDLRFQHTFTNQYASPF